MMHNETPEQETALYDQPEQPTIEAMSDRELLVSIAHDIAATKELVAEFLTALEPILGDAKIKLLLKMFT